MNKKGIKVNTTIEAIGFSQKWTKEIADCIDDSNRRVARAYVMIQDFPDLMNPGLREVGEVHDQTGCPYHTITRLIAAARKEAQRNARRS